MRRSKQVQAVGPTVQLLKPALKAYVLAYISVVGPECVGLVLSARKEARSRARLLSSLRNIILKSVEIRRFPAICAILLGSFKLFEHALSTALNYANALSRQRLVPGLLSTTWSQRICRFAASYIAAWYSIELLALRPSSSAAKPKQNGSAVKQNGGVKEVTSPEAIDTQSRSDKSAGRTLDLTFFGVTRAIDALLVHNLTKNSFNRGPTSHTKPSRLLGVSDAALFAASSGAIMWSWFYHPDRLPRAYNRWISRAAEVDMRLIEALRKAKAGDFVYGEEKGEQARVLQSMCRDYGWPASWGDPAVLPRIPCEMVHMGAGPNCHWHAVARLARAFRFAMITNLPLQLLAKGVSRKRAASQVITDACGDATRSSAFLASFIMLMYYGICLSRTQAGPRLFSSAIVTPQMWDSGLCVASACTLCGWSILIEKPKRRQELAMFVAPRALATLFPRRYSKECFWIERTAFSLSTASLFTIFLEDRGSVRGLLGSLLGQIFGS